MAYTRLMTVAEPTSAENFKKVKGEVVSVWHRLLVIEGRPWTISIHNLGMLEEGLA